MTRFVQAIAVVFLAVVAFGNSEASAQNFNRSLSDFTFQPSDNAFDFEVYMAEDVSPVYHVKVRRPDGTWEYEISYNFSPGAGTSSPGSKLEWNSYFGALHYGLRLKRNGEATDFLVVEHWPQPSWDLIATVDTFEEAEFLAGIIEDNFGVMTKIDWFQSNNWMSHP